MESTLFRFVTLRNPQLISEKEKEKGFVFFPESSTNSFTTAVSSRDPSVSKGEALNTASENFSPLVTVTAIRELNSALFDFSSWLLRNKNILTSADVSSNIGTADALSDATYQLVWENLMYQTISKRNPNVREACIQLLIAHNFISKNDIDSRAPSEQKLINSTEDLRKLACASIVIPKSIDTSDVKNDFKPLPNNRMVDKDLSAELEIERSRIRINMLEEARREIEKLEEEINRKNREAYELQIVDFRRNVNVALDQNLIRGATFELLNDVRFTPIDSGGGTPIVGDGGNTGGGDPIGGGGTGGDPIDDGGTGGGTGGGDGFLDSDPILADTNSVEPNTTPSEISNNEILNTANLMTDAPDGVEIEVDPLKLDPSLLGPAPVEFNFVPVDTFDITNLSGRISANTLKTINSLELDNEANCDTLLAAIDKEEEQINSIQEKQLNRKEVNVRVGGVTVSRRNTASSLYCYSVGLGGFDQQKDIQNGNITYDNVLMNIDLGNIFTSVSSADYRFEVIDSQALDTPFLIPGTTIQVLNNQLRSSRKIVGFFPEGIRILNVLGRVGRLNGRLVGRLTLTDGTILAIDQSVAIDTTKTNNGCATVVDEDEEGSQPEDKFFGISKIGIADFRRVDQSVCCYIPGEVSHIENILAREYKEKTARNFTSEEQINETTNEAESEVLTDTTSTERNELSTEISSILNEDQSRNSGVAGSVSGGFGPISFSASAFANFASSSSSSNSNSTARNEAQEITERALDRLVQKTTTKRISSILREYEETNKHAFDNREGDKNVTGVYRWVDKIYKNQLVNYGKRLTYEFMIPEPASFFKTAIIEEAEQSESTNEIGEIIPNIPKSPVSRGISSAAALTRANYQTHAAYYGIDIDAPPAASTYISGAFSKSQVQDNVGRSKNKAITEAMEVPEGYVTTSASIKGEKYQGVVYVTVGDALFTLGQNNRERSIDPHRSELAVSVFFNESWITIVNVIVKCNLTPEAFANWQNDVYNQIQIAYKERVDQYNDYVRSQQPDVDTEVSRITIGSGQFRSLEKRELKRNAIEMLTRPYGIQQGQEKVVVNQNNVPIATLNADSDKYGNQIKFFEQAFDWDIMAYNFYPYYWAKQADWKSLFQSTEGNDPTFQAFLQSGMARMVVPVRPGFEQAVLYYLETGEVFAGENVSLENDLYLSIVDELRETEGAVEETWETRVPTTLNIVQSNSAKLNEGGLPCSCDEHQGFESVSDLLGDNSNPATTTSVETDVL